MKKHQKDILKKNYNHQNKKKKMDKFTTRLEKAEERIRTKIGRGRKYPDYNIEKKENGKYKKIS